VGVRSTRDFRNYVREWALLDILGVLVGIAGGLGAVAFRYVIGLSRLFFFNILQPRLALYVSGYNVGIALLPALGGLIVGSLTMKFAPETKGHGVPEVMEAVALKMGIIRKRVAFVKVCVSSVTIGSGGSAGREGPIAQIGAAIGSLVGQLLKLPAQSIRLLVVCGLSAGIAGTFNAPLGGALFGMEVLLRGVGLHDAIPVLLASVVGAAVADVFLGQEPAFITPPITSWSPYELPLYILLGAVFGILAVIWVKLFYAIEGFFDRLRVHPYFKPAIGGLITGFLAAPYVELGVMGVGYEGVNMALSGRLPLDLLFTLGILKIAATSLTLGSGGSGGVFAPTLYIGSMFGAAMGILFNTLFPSLVEHPFTYSLAGMGALFAGAAKAPLNVIVMIPEMSGDYALIPPLMASSATSFIVSWILLKGSSIYTLKLERRGVSLRMGRYFNLDVVKVGDVMTRNVVTVTPDTPLPILEIMFEEHGHVGYPVVENGRLVGMVTLSDLLRVPKERRAEMKVRDVASTKLVTAYPDETLYQALNKMWENDISRLPIVDRENPQRLIGIISKKDIIRALRMAAYSPEAT